MTLALSPLTLRAADLAILQNGFEIRHEQREVLGGNTRLYLTADPAAGFVDVPTIQIIRYAVKPQESTSAAQSKPLDIKSVVDEASKTHSIDADLIASVIHAESRFNPRALSPKGAQGLMQLMPGTASKLGVTDAFDPHSNVDGGTRYLRELLLRYDDDLIKALAAYNAGPHRVDQYHGVPPYRETRLYVASIIRDFNQKKLAQQQANVTQASPAQKSTSAKAVTRKPAAH
jgi:soluble lytic murein transglycosylase-like protein